MKFNTIYDRLISGESKLALVGLGYVGMPIAVAFAKKVDVIGFDLNSNTMHGYPIDHRIDPRQKPDNTALKILKENNKITKTEMIKISRGKAL